MTHMNTMHCTRNRLSATGRIAGFYRAILMMAAIILAGCAESSDSGGPPFSADLLPPMILSSTTLDERRILIVFDEPIHAPILETAVKPVLPMADITPDGSELIITFSEDQSIGVDYVLRMSVSDGSGNSLSFLYRFSGWNPDVPDILVNELNPRGSSSTPDCVELLAKSSGNLGGLRLLIGTVENYSAELIFPALEVAAGDFIVVHAKPEGLPEEVDELEGLDESGGRLALDTARDFWLSDAPGIPGNNGAVTLFSRRGGPVLDAVIWSDREELLEEERLGWTADGYDFACDLADTDEWIWDGDTAVPSPEDAVDVSSSTATRSLCRRSSGVDTDGREDWHTVPTSGQTFGLPNSDEVYVP